MAITSTKTFPVRPTNRERNSMMTTKVVQILYTSGAADTADKFAMDSIDTRDDAKLSTPFRTRVQMKRTDANGSNFADLVVYGSDVDPSVSAGDAVVADTLKNQSVWASGTFQLAKTSVQNNVQAAIYPSGHSRWLAVAIKPPAAGKAVNMTITFTMDYI